MKRQGLESGDWGLAIVLAFLVASPSSFADDQRPNVVDGDLRITVRIYDYAHVSRGILMAAEAEATEILRKAGIETVWAECSVREERSQIDPACQREFGPTDLHLIMLARAMAKRLDFRDAELGRAPAPTEIAPGSYGRVFYVFYDRVNRLVEGRDISEAQILGHAIAHEIGHVLLPVLGHTSTGVMRARWSGKDLQSVARGNLHFAPEEAQQLRAAVRARTRALATGQVGGLVSAKWVGSAGFGQR